MKWDLNFFNVFSVRSSFFHAFMSSFKSRCSLNWFNPCLMRLGWSDRLFHLTKIQYHPNPLSIREKSFINESLSLCSSLKDLRSQKKVALSTLCTSINVPFINSSTQIIQLSWNGNWFQYHRTSTIGLSQFQVLLPITSRNWIFEWYFVCP